MQHTGASWHRGGSSETARGPARPHTAQKTAAGPAETAYAKPLSTACKFDARTEVCNPLRRSRRKLPQTSA